MTLTQPGWQSADYLVFDHQVHKYTPEEVNARLEPPLGREIMYAQTYSRLTSTCLGTLQLDEGSYTLVNAGRLMVDLTAQLTKAKDQHGPEAALHTILIVNRNDRHLEAVVEHQIREMRE